MADVNTLVPHPMNPNKHGERQIEMLAKIIKYQGFRNPIVVSKRSGFIVAGHGRLMAAQKLGLNEVPVDEQDFKDEAAEFSHLIADNKIAELAEHDDNAMIDGIKTLGIEDLELLGLDNFELPAEPVEAKCDEDEIPEVVEPRTKLGDVYRLGNHRLMCGDSTSVDAVEKLMDGQRADMVFTDPPYGINEKGERGKRFGKDSIMEKGVNYKSFVDDSIQYAIDAFNLCQGLNINLQVWWGANYYCHSLPQQNNWLVWDKRVEDYQSDFNSDAELAWVKDGHSSVRIFRHLWKGLIKASERSEKRVHPTQKPIALAEWCFTKYGDPKSVLDLFGGSGSTLIACEKTNRKCFMMELDPHYCDVIVARWEKYTGKKAELIG